MGQLQKPLQPGPLRAPELGNPHPAVSPAQDRSDGDDDPQPRGCAAACADSGYLPSTQTGPQASGSERLCPRLTLTKVIASQAYVKALQQALEVYGNTLMR